MHIVFAYMANVFDAVTMHFVFGHDQSIELTIYCDSQLIISILYAKCVFELFLPLFQTQLKESSKCVPYTCKKKIFPLINT